MRRVYAILLASAMTLASAQAEEPGASFLVPVASRTEADRTNAMKEAFREKLTQASGENPELLQTEAAQTALRKVTHYVQGFRYVRDNDQWKLQVTFDPDLWDSLIREIGINPTSAILPETPETVTFKIHSIQTPDQYQQLMATLQALSALSLIQVSHVDSETIEIQANLKGSLETLLVQIDSQALMRCEPAEKNSIVCQIQEPHSDS